MQKMLKKKINHPKTNKMLIYIIFNEIDKKEFFLVMACYNHASELKVTQNYFFNFFYDHTISYPIYHKQQ